MVQTGGTLSGSGTIQPSGVNAITVQSGGNLAPGGVQNLSTANGNLTLDTSSFTGPTILSTGTTGTGQATLTFALGTGNTSSQIVVTGGNANNINFNFNTVVTINDLTGGTGLTLNQEYILIQGTTGPNGTTYSGLNLDLVDPPTSNGILITGGLTLLSPTLTNSFSENYGGSYLYLVGNDIEIEVGAIPEPSTWGALMLGGLALLVYQRRRQRKLNPGA